MAPHAGSLAHTGAAEDSMVILDVLFAKFPQPDFQVRLWDGRTWGAAENPRFTLVLNHPSALRQMFDSQNEAALGEAYIYNDFDIEGDVESAMRLGDALLQTNLGLTKKLHVSSLLRKLPVPQHGAHPERLSGPVHSRERDKQAIAYHYNLPTEFYSLFLDYRLVYSCAYFRHAEDDIDTAQLQKLDHICRKLRLRPGDRLLDIGCGWGGLIIHAAKVYGVKALGITLSAPQAEVARQRIEAVGVADRCRVEVRDYRDFNERESYNKIVSVGMFEHVGENLLPEYFERAWRILQPGGVFLNHGIALSGTYQPRPDTFSSRYVFPDGELVPVNVTVKAAEDTSFEVRDVESLREHYALTLRQWVKRLEANADRAKQVTNDVTYRIWRLYMSGSVHRFSTAKLNLYQILLAKPQGGKTGLPLTREDWYRPAHAG